MAEKTNITRETPPEQIEQDIARTRREMSGTVNEIQERLSPRTLGNQAKERIRTATVDRVKDAANRIGDSAKIAGSNIMDTVRENMIPFAMMSAGLVWFLANRSREQAGDGEYIYERASQLREKAGDMTEKAQSKMYALSGQMREQGGQWADRISSVAKERTQQTTSWFQDRVRDNPLAVMFAAFAVGAAVGFSIPESGKEQQMMGSASDSLFERAKQGAQKAIHKAQHAAEKAVHTAQEEYKHS